MRILNKNQRIQDANIFNCHCIMLETLYADINIVSCICVCVCNVFIIWIFSHQICNIFKQRSAFSIKYNNNNFYLHNFWKILCFNVKIYLTRKTQIFIIYIVSAQTLVGMNTFMCTGCRCYSNMITSQHTTRIRGGL